MLSLLSTIFFSDSLPVPVECTLDKVPPSKSEYIRRMHLTIINPFWPTGTNHPPSRPHIENVITFERVMVLTWNFMTLIEIFWVFLKSSWPAKKMHTKNFSCPVFNLSQHFSGTHLFLPKKLVLLCSCNLNCFHKLTLSNLYQRVSKMFMM